VPQHDNDSRRLSLAVALIPLIANYSQENTHYYPQKDKLLAGG
jgi:hypothetical protein